MIILLRIFIQPISLQIQAFCIIVQVQSYTGWITHSSVDLKYRHDSVVWVQCSELYL